MSIEAPLTPMELEHGLNLLSRSKEIIIDSEPLFLLLVGEYNKELITRCKRTKKFQVSDFDFLNGILAKNKQKLIITPQVIAEISNHANIGIENRYFGEFINSIIKYLTTKDEIYINKNKLFENTFVRRLGFTDVGLIEATTTHEQIILTCDSGLVQCCYEKGIKVFDFEKVRLSILLASQ